MRAAPQPEPWKGRIVRYKKLPSVESEEAGNESSSSEEDLGTRVAKLAGNDPRERGYGEAGNESSSSEEDLRTRVAKLTGKGPRERGYDEAGNESNSSEEDLRTRVAKLAGNGPTWERGYDGTGTDGERDWSATDPGSAERLALDPASVPVNTWERGAERLALDPASVPVDTWERGAVPKSPDEWSSARSSLVWEEEEETEEPAVYERPPAAGRLPAPPVHRKLYNKPIELLEVSSSSSNSLAPPYHSPVRVEPNTRRPGEPVRIGLPEERVSERLTNGDYHPLRPEGPSNHGRTSRERVSIDMPDEVVISSQPSNRAGREILDEVFIAERPRKRDAADHGLPGARGSTGGPKGRTAEETPRETVSTAGLEVLLSTGSTEEREARPGTGSTEVREARPGTGSTEVQEVSPGTGNTEVREASPSTGSSEVREARPGTGSTEVLEALSSTGSPRVRITSTPTSISTAMADVITNTPPKEAPPSGSRQSVSPLRWDPNFPGAARNGDPLGYDVYARSIAEIVTDEKTEMPLTVGVYGGWGMGKTYLLAKMKEAVDNIVGEKGKEHEDFVKGEVDGVEQNKSRGQKTRFPAVLFCVLLALFLVCLGATIACGLLFDRVWVVFLVGTVVAFVLLVATVVYGFRRRILGCCAKKVPLLQKSNPMHWMVGIYLEWVDPPNMAETPKPQKYEVIWVHFNAWEFSGCKVLWAGIVTTLCDAIEAKVGYKPARFFRVIQGQLNGGGKKAIFRRAWFKLLLSAVGVLILVVIVLVLALSGGFVELNNFMQGPQIKGIIGSITGFLSLGIVVHLRKGLDIVKNMAKSQKEKLDARMKKPDFAEQLGFMSEVKSEVQTVTSLLRFLEHVMRIQYRVIIVVDDLDCCPGDRVIGVLESMNILLSDEESNIISIVAMDPKIVVNCLESRLTDTITNNSSGYEYLRRIVNFPVCLPEPSVADRRKLLYTVVQGKAGILVRQYVSVRTGRISFKAGTKAREGYQDDAQGRTSPKGRPSLWTALPDAPYDLENQDGGRLALPNQDGGTREGPSAPLLLTPKESDELDAAETTLMGAFQTQVSTHELINNFKQDVVEEVYEDYLGDVIQELNDDDDDAENDIMPYIHGNALHITSLYHILRMTVMVLRYRKLLQCVTPRQVALWVILVEQWPYRTSWVLQYIEDSQQKDRIRQRCHQATGEKEIQTISIDTKLSDVFHMVKPELNVDDFRRLNNLDGDPEMFELLLGESKFTVKDMLNLLPCTINLDYSIQRRIASVRGLSLE